MSEKNYPLVEVIAIKRRRLEEAEKNLRDKKAILEQENLKLEKLQKELDEAKKIYDTYMVKLRAAMDEGEPSYKIDQHKIHLRDLKDKYFVIQKKVDDQKKVVKKAEDAVEEARTLYMQKEKEVEKLKLHKTEWLKALEKEEQRQEEIKMDEISQSSFLKKSKE
jgi:flagellar biosynthesis chaperone FliJ